MTPAQKQKQLSKLADEVIKLSAKARLLNDEAAAVYLDLAAQQLHESTMAAGNGRIYSSKQ
jgi:cell division protein FtsB